MNLNKLLELKQRLNKWREERHLSLEMQRAGYLVNVLDEVREYYLAKTDDEKVAELCDIVIFSLNALGDETISEKIKDYLNYYDDVTDAILQVLALYEWFILDNESGRSALLRLISLVMLKIEKEHKKDPLKCLEEKIKEIESRTGYYDEYLKKFIKDKGAYTQEEAQELIYKDYGKDIEIKNSGENEYFFWFALIENNQPLGVVEKIKKWYKADFKDCDLKE